MITLRELTDELGDALVFPNQGREAPHRTVAGVHISELPDPTQYLSGGELLLTTGLSWVEDHEFASAYVRRLAQQKVCALGFGLGPLFSEVPQLLVEACERFKLDLLLVPDGVSFQQVTRAFWHLAGKNGLESLERSLGLQSALARDITRPDGVKAVVRQLAQSLGGWAVFESRAAGRATTVWPESAATAVKSLQTLPEKMKRADVNAVVSFEFRGQQVLKFPVAAGEQLYGFLAVCPQRKLSAGDKYVIRTACALLMMKARQQQSYSAGIAALGEAVVKLLANGHTDAARLLSENVGLGELPARLYVLGLIGDEYLDESDWARAVPALQRAAGVPCIAEAVAQSPLMTRINNVLVILFPEKRVKPETEQDDIAGWGENRVAGVLVEPVEISEIPAAISTVRRAARRVPAGHIIKAGARDRVRAEEWAATLAGYPRADLLGTVTTYIKHRGQWEPTSRELGVHRNSVRHRIENAEKLLGVSLDDPNVFAPLWLALRDRVGDEEQT